MGRQYKVTVTSQAEIPGVREMSEENLREILWYGFCSLMDEAGATPPESMSIEPLSET